MAELHIQRLTTYSAVECQGTSYYSYPKRTTLPAELFSVTGPEVDSLAQGKDLGAVVVQTGETTEIHIRSFPHDEDREYDNDPETLEYFAEHGDPDTSRYESADMALAALSIRPPLAPEQYHRAIAGLLTQAIDLRL